MTSLQIQNVFEDFDSNNDGLLTIEEICQWMNKLGVQLNKGKLSELVKRCDWNGDGYLDFKEFVTLNSSLEELGVNSALEPPSSDDKVDDEGEMREAFSMYDKDGNGLISPEELRLTLTELGLISSTTTSMERVESMIRKVDKDGDGQVNFTEFETMLNDQ